MNKTKFLFTISIDGNNELYFSESHKIWDLVSLGGTGRDLPQSLCYNYMEIQFELKKKQPKFDKYS